MALTGLAIYVAWATLARSTTSKQGAGALLALIVIGVLIVGGLSRALSNLKTWARGPAIVLELLLLPIGYTMISGGLAYVGIPVMRRRTPRGWPAAGPGNPYGARARSLRQSVTRPAS